MDCDCPLWIYGNTETTHVPRQSTGTNIIAVAEAQRQTLLKNGQDQKVHGPRLGTGPIRSQREPRSDGKTVAPSSQPERTRISSASFLRGLSNCRSRDRYFLFLLLLRRGIYRGPGDRRGARRPASTFKTGRGSLPHGAFPRIYNPTSRPAVDEHKGVGSEGALQRVRPRRLPFLCGPRPPFRSS